MDMPKPTKEHDWLQRLVGRWEYESEMLMGPDQPKIRSSGVWDFRSLGGFWVVAEGEGTSPEGETHTSITTIGFDPGTGRFVGTFICSPMSKLWIYDGALEGDDRLVLAATGPSFTGEGEALYHDIYEISGDDGFRLISRVEGAPGEWTEFMTADYRRAA